MLWQALSFTVASAVVAFIGGCANPGPPRPPTLNLPATVTDVTASRVGDRVELHWTTPTRTTDGLDLTRPTTSRICRDPWPSIEARSPSQNSAAPQPHPCTPVLQLPSQPGEMRASIQLPPDLTEATAPTVLDYRVIVSNAAGRSAVPSPPAVVPGGPAIPPVTDFRASQIKAGVLLQWAEPKLPGSLTRAEEVVELLRTLDSSSTSLSNAPGGAHTSAPLPPTGSPRKPTASGGAVGGLAATRKKPDETRQDVRLRAEHSRSSTIPSQLIDITPSMGETYFYRAQRVRTVLLEGRPVEMRSEPTPPVAIALRDTFPPDTPSGLVSVLATSPGSSSPALDLSWQPNTDPDLTGYFIYRAELNAAKGSQPAERRLNQEPIPGPAFHDASVLPGHRYRYRVTAVDHAGNESQPSAPVVDTP